MMSDERFLFNETIEEWREIDELVGWEVEVVYREKCFAEENGERYADDETGDYQGGWFHGGRRIEPVLIIYPGFEARINSS